MENLLQGNESTMISRQFVGEEIETRRTAAKERRKKQRLWKTWKKVDISLRGSFFPKTALLQDDGDDLRGPSRRPSCRSRSQGFLSSLPYFVSLWFFFLSDDVFFLLSLPCFLSLSLAPSSLSLSLSNLSPTNPSPQAAFWFSSHVYWCPLY